MNAKILLAALLVPLVLAAPASADTQRYYGPLGTCVESLLTCTFIPPGGARVVHVAVEDDVSGPLCFHVQFVVRDGQSYAYASGYGSGSFTIPSGTTRLNVYAEALGSVSCALDGRVAAPTTGTITVAFG